jgi:hypothetical protein
MAFESSTSTRVTVAGAQPIAHAVARVANLLSGNAMILTVAAAYAVLWAFAAPWLIEADSWMTLLDGREIAQHGLPHHITLTLLGRGEPWIDQQWLAALFFHALYVLGGWQLSLTATCLALLVPIALAMTLAQRRGASATTILPFALLPLLSFTSFLRAQVLAPVLFVALVALLAAQSRRRSAAVYLVFPVLALWANIHGSVLVGAALVALLGALELPQAVRRRSAPAVARGAALTVLPWLCLLATPYGLATIDYYRATVDNPALHAFEKEWQAPTFTTPAGFPLYVLAGVTLWLVGRRRRDLTSFELGTLVVTLVAALDSARSIAWFLYPALMFVPPLAERAWRKERPASMPTRVGAPVALGAALIAGLALVSIGARSDRSLEAAWPPRAVAAVGGLLRGDPHARVFASYEYADWLLYRVPDARGRVAFNGHLELLSARDLRSALAFLDLSSPTWRRAAAGYRIVVLDPHTDGPLLRALRAEPSTRVVFSSRTVVVLDRRT